MPPEYRRIPPIQRHAQIAYARMDAHFAGSGPFNVESREDEGDGTDQDEQTSSRECAYDGEVGLDDQGACKRAWATNDARRGSVERRSTSPPYPSEYFSTPSRPPLWHRKQSANRPGPCAPFPLAIKPRTAALSLTARRPVEPLTAWQSRHDVVPVALNTRSLWGLTMSPRSSCNPARDEPDVPLEAMFGA